VATTKFDQSDLAHRPALASYSLGRQWKQLTDGLVRTRSRVATSVFWHCATVRRKIAGGAHRTAFLCDTSRISEGEGETGRQALQAQSGDLQGLPVFGSVGLDGLILKAWMGARSLLVVRYHSLTPSDQIWPERNLVRKKTTPSPAARTADDTIDQALCAHWRDQRVCHRFLALMRGRRTNS
jgi:hypothetical protein